MTQRHGGNRLPSGSIATLGSGTTAAANANGQTRAGRVVPPRDVPYIEHAVPKMQESPRVYEKSAWQDHGDFIAAAPPVGYPTAGAGVGTMFVSQKNQAQQPRPFIMILLFQCLRLFQRRTKKHSVMQDPTRHDERPTSVPATSQSQVPLRELYTSSHHAPVPTRRRMHQKGYRNLFSARTAFRWKANSHWNPDPSHAHQKPGHIKGSGQIHRHRDAVSRIHKGVEDDRFIAPDSHIERMMVQCTDEIYEGPRNSTWRRTFVRNKAPAAIRVANWPMNTAPLDSEHWTQHDWMLIVLKWPVSCIVLSVMLLKVGKMYGGTSRLAHYAPFPYRYWGYPKVARNMLENVPARIETNEEVDGAHPVSERPLYPSRLCFVDGGRDRTGRTHLYEVSLWLEQHNMVDHDMKFIFVAYTSTQFTDSDEDTEALHAIARKAAIELKCPAYWVGSACMSEGGQELEQDVYRISDVIRAAHSVVIAIKPQPGRKSNCSTNGLLTDWGTRMWTLPEALLAPKDHPIRIYNVPSGRVQLVKELPKKDLAALVWPEDIGLTRQLVDHYEGNLTLSRLELVILALKCLSQRRTSPYLDGDLAYVLMGLLRRRPTVDHTDSEFQAFARLSLANDSDNLLERLLCVLPRSQNQPWYHTADMFGVNLWDIQPTCQVAGVCEDDTVVLDGCFGASIRWESFVAVAHTTSVSWKRTMAKLWIRIAPILLIFAVALPSAVIVAGQRVILLLFSLPIFVISPWLVRILYGGKPWNIAPHFLGFEGYLDIVTIETNIYGHYSGRLTWSPAGSNLSRHQMNEYGECIGEDPTSDGLVADMVKQAKYSNYGEQKVFTLVDTLNGSVTLFTATRPPVAALLCGQEGGMQRAVMVSLDWKTSTLYRETVLRMPTTALERTWRMDRARVGLKRPLARTVLAQSA
ncbi:hypothetical protein LTS03_007596 [Exophiala xenobiotica]|nr:hypothetical protein LTR61_010225 [Exophiala xenobiotica]KAK5370102.1 hypothetical protein LTS03_007596 [Exophiala xenobiotica]KAK5479408.1 hypothetical protein LTR83_010498 [Exophiala xenobiotica]